MNCKRQYLGTCSPKVKPRNLKQINTTNKSRSTKSHQHLKVAESDKSAYVAFKQWLPAWMPACLAKLLGPVQQQNDRLGEKNKSTKAFAALWSDLKRKSKAIHTFNASTLRQLRYWILHPSQRASPGAKYKPSETLTLREDCVFEKCQPSVVKLKKKKRVAQRWTQVCDQQVTWEERSDETL